MRTAAVTLAAIVLLAHASIFAQEPQDTTTYRLTGTRIAFGQDVRIERDEEVTDAAVVVAGNLEVNGRVRDGIVVVGGDLHLSSTADVRGDIVLVGGALTREPGAQISGGIDYVSFGEWTNRNFGWFGTVRFGEFPRWMFLLGTMARLSVLGVLMALMLIVARAPVARAGRAALAEPLRAFVIGLIAEIFFLPLLIAAAIGLAITVIGIPFALILLPLAIVLAVFAFVLGFTALACRLGEWIEDRLGWQPGSALIATAIGYLVLLGPTLVARLVDVLSVDAWPLTYALVAVGLTVEFIAWTIGLGAAVTTGLGRWYTVPPPISAPPAAPAAAQPA